MNVQHTISISGNAYHVQIGPDDRLSGSGLTPVEYEAFARFGEPVIDCGGTFTLGEGTFTLPANELRYPSQFPILQLFALDDFADAGDRADAFRAQILAKLAAAKDAVLEKQANHVGTQISTL